MLATLFGNKLITISPQTGVFNVSVLVSNNNGRSSSDESSYRMSGTGQTYNFETYAGMCRRIRHGVRCFSDVLVINSSKKCLND